MTRDYERDGYIINGKNSKEFTEEFRDRFIVIKISNTLKIMIDTQTGVQYMMAYPTEFTQGNNTVSIVPIIDDSGFPFTDSRFIKKG